VSIRVKVKHISRLKHLVYINNIFLSSTRWIFSRGDGH